MERLYQEGWNSVQLGLRYDRTPPTIRYHLRKRGATVRSRGEANRLRAPSARCQVDEAKLRELHGRGLRTREIGSALGVSAETVRRRLRDLGIARHQRGAPGERNRHWQGGRIVDDDGYVLVHRPDHPFATKAGYMREHRLVMEAHLGRYLDPSEVVHHADKNPQNNAPSNLKLYATNAEHLRDEQTGVPKNVSPEGRRRLQAAGRKSGATRRAKASRKASGSGARQSR